MLNDARRANPLVPWRIVWLAVALIALPGVIAGVVILLSTASTTSGGGGKPTAAPGSSSAQASAACAASSRAPVNSTRDGARDEVVPPGPTAVLLCRYGPRGARVREVSITSSTTVTELAARLNALPSASGAYACPSDEGETITADFSYASGPENPVSIRLSGCQTVTNGHVTRLGLDHPVIGQAGRLIPWLGTIRGRLEVCGGPSRSGCRRTTGFTTCVASRCLHADQVVIMHAIGIPYPNVRLRHGRFTVRVEPGRYRLVLLGDGRLGHDRVIARTRAQVRLDRTTRVAFRLSAP